MVNIPMRSASPLTRQNITSINQLRIQGPKSSRDIITINKEFSKNSHSVNTGASNTRPIPPLLHLIQKGQKVPLSPQKQISVVKACLGWNTTNSDCDVDVSAFMLNSSGKVIGDTWFVFYGQTASPDHSTEFKLETAMDRESITINLNKLHSAVSKIVFVLTINEAVQRGLNFSMLKDAYIRLIDPSDNTEFVSFKMDEYYANVTSMMIGEIYLYNGIWKFNAIGNGVARDLAGLCELYGVQVI